METTSPGPRATGLLRIGDAARTVGVSPSALRLWERQGLVTPQRPRGRERRYGPAEMEQLRRVRRLRAVEGLNAAGIRRVLESEPPRPGTHRPPPPDDTAPPVDARAVGSRLRGLRTAAGLSLRDVAARSGLSASFVSSLERGTTGASVAALVRLAGVFGMSVSALVGAPAEPARPAASRLVRHGERRAVEAGRGVRIEELAALATHLEPQLFVLAPGATSDGAYAHAGEEFMFVLQGRVAVWLDAHERHELGPGDALTFPSSLPHRFVALGADETRILWVNTPPSF
jgi:DNA-binding transcriptional MerR regulator/mannose-6-phosphate isomerase-like protein (cupin superfamily)